MAGGTWSETDRPVLPGFYLNFKAAALASIALGERGVVLLPVCAHWGPDLEFVTIERLADAVNYFTTDVTGSATAYDAIRLALMGGAKTVIAYRMASSAAAKGAITLKDTTGGSAVSVMTLTAFYKGARDLKVTVRTNAIDSGKKDILLYDGTTLLKTWVVSGTVIQSAVDTINADSGNLIVAAKLASGNGVLAAITTQDLTGGDSGISGLVVGDYTDAMDAFETQTFNTLALDGISSSTIQTAFVTWVKQVRAEGKLIQMVMGGSAANDIDATAVTIATGRSNTDYDEAGIINVGVGGILDDVSYSSAMVACYVAGLIAGKNLNESVTYAPTPFSDVTRRWTAAEQRLAVTNGVFLLVNDGRKVKVLKGINSLNTLSGDMNAQWKKVRTIRSMDAMSTDMLRTAEDLYIGKVNNNANGRGALIEAFKEYMRTMAMGGVIETTGWVVELDPDYYGATPTGTLDPDQVAVKWEAYITDSMEQILGTFIVK